MLVQRRLDRLWQSTLGAAYWAANRGVDPRRGPFWRAVCQLARPASVLEVGCGRGQNLSLLPSGPLAVGMDIDHRTLQAAPGYRVCGSALMLPFADKSFDLVLTCGLLIHLTDEAVPPALDELARVARKHVLLIEYEDSHDRAISWRGQDSALWARPFSLRFWGRHPEFLPVLRFPYTERDVLANYGFAGCASHLFGRQPE